MTSNHGEPMRTIRRERRALAILRTLQRESGYQSNERILLDYLNALALGGTSVEIGANLDDLERMGLLKIKKVESVRVVELTQRGEEVALGQVIMEGVLRPGPECPY